MTIPKFLPLAAMFLLASWLSAAEEPAESYVRIEARGKLGVWKRPAADTEQYIVTITRANGSETVFLTITDEATRKLAKELSGEVVVIAGDYGGCQIIGDGKRKETKATYLSIRVNSIKKADPPKK